eukprot:2476423-Pleurochrysis_carterae.AAC.1
MDAAHGGERRPRVGFRARDGDQRRAGAGQADTDAGQTAAAERPVRRGRNVHVRRDAASVGRARSHSAGERAHVRKAQRHPVLHGEGR